MRRQRECNVPCSTCDAAWKRETATMRNTRISVAAAALRWKRHALSRVGLTSWKRKLVDTYSTRWPHAACDCSALCREYHQRMLTVQRPKFEPFAKWHARIVGSARMKAERRERRRVLRAQRAASAAAVGFCTS